MPKTYGFLPPEVKDTDYQFLGATKLKSQILEPTGQWDNWLPEIEYQSRNGFESSNCTNYGTLAALEVLHRRHFNKEENWSERYTGVMTGTTPEGNSVNRVIEIIRKTCGLIPEKVLPFSKDINAWDKYYSPCPMSEELVLMGKNFLVLYQIGYEWVFTQNSANKQDKMKAALRESPLGVSVAAWYGPNDKGYYYKPSGSDDNHWCLCYGFEDKKFWKIYDTYDATLKRLEWNYNFNWGMKYTLQKKTPTQSEKQGFIANMQRALEIIKQKLLEISAQIKGRLGAYWAEVFK